MNLSDWWIAAGNSAEIYLMVSSALSWSNSRANSNRLSRINHAINSALKHIRDQTRNAGTERVPWRLPHLSASSIRFSNGTTAKMVESGLSNCKYFWMDRMYKLW